MTAKILVVDDEAKIVKLVRSYLEQAGFAVVEAADGQTALIQARREQPDLIVLDLGLPGLDGIEVTRTLRRERATPIIMLTARIEDTDKIVGLELGADDYITKPFNPRELVARVRSVLRRTGSAAPAPAVLRAGEMVLDTGGHQATLDGRILDLTPTEFELLAVLLQNPGRVFTRLELLDRVQGDAYEGYERTIDAHIKNLRAKLGDDPRRPRFIQTVFGIGYKLGGLGADL
ncbi:MAG: response regulator transcription factor [Anaerolineae bacterium]|uniref:response regulator transcription factor n=1 Tax=Candidatus Amarolinea dominans TaxID=3140696 RepID=UPI003135A1D0|nr:response regulator transcription factor [Anaerolineae bacterium]MBK9229984.1 response regulator transcription factor [Anaerolineae bacterium]